MTTEALTAEIRIGDKTLALPVTIGTENEVGVDIQALRDKTGAITFDPGYGNTGACESAVTFLDGENGILRYRGYPIEQLAGAATFLEVSWLLLKGELPTAAEYAEFEAAEKANRAVPAYIKAIIAAMPNDTHPMAMLSAAIVSLSNLDAQGKETLAGLNKNQLLLMAQLPTIAAYIYRHSQGLALVEPSATLGYAATS
jgi:citrate synthase